MKQQTSIWEMSKLSLALETAFFGLQRLGRGKPGLFVAFYVLLAFMMVSGFNLPGMNLQATSFESVAPLNSHDDVNQLLETLPPVQDEDLVEPRCANLDLEPRITKAEVASPEVVLTTEWGVDVPVSAPSHKREGVAIVGQNGVIAPIFTHRTPPTYPQRAAQVRLQGYVILQAVLRKSGAVDNIKVLRGLGRGRFGFEEAAVESLRNWEFKPGLVDGEPADVRMNLRVDFIMN